MNSRTDHTLPGQERSEEDMPKQPGKPAPSYLEGTPVSSGKEKPNELMDRDETDPTEGEDGIVMGTDADVSEEEIMLLEDATDYMPTTDEESLKQSALDNTDEDGDPLNEVGFGEDVSGSDLDIPGGEDDDELEEMGEEDEENNSYSIGGDGHTDLDEKTS